MNSKVLTIIVIILVVVIGAAIYYLLPKPHALQKNMSQQTSDQNQPAPDNSSSFNIQGMKVETLKQGTGEGAKNGDLVTVNYTGTLTNGTEFDSSLNSGRSPFQFTLGQNSVIQGWELGLVGMKAGEERKLTIPPEMAYGAQSPSPLIPANSTLVFDITMISIGK